MMMMMIMMSLIQFDDDDDDDFRDLGVPFGVRGCETLNPKNEWVAAKPSTLKKE